MKQREKTYVTQFDWSHHNHGWGACTLAAKEIAIGRIVKFDIFDPGKRDGQMLYRKTLYFGQAEVDGAMAIRECHNINLTGSSTRSIISTGYPKDVKDPVAIAARLMLCLTREGSDCFFNTEAD